MNTITAEEFRAMLATAGWSREQGIEVADNRDSRVAWVDGEEVTVPRIWGWGGVDHAKDDITIQYVESWSYDEGAPESFTADADGLDYAVHLVGVTITDEDGEPLTNHEVFRMLQREFPRFIDIDYSGLVAAIEEAQ